MLKCMSLCSHSESQMRFRDAHFSCASTRRTPTQIALCRHVRFWRLYDEWEQTKEARLKVSFETSHYNPRYHSNCAFAPLRDSIKSFALTRHHGIPYLLARRNRRKFQVISSEGMGPLISPLPVHTTHRLSESLNIGLSSSSLLRFILLNCPHCSAFSSRCQHLFSFFRKNGAQRRSQPFQITTSEDLISYRQFYYGNTIAT